MDNGLDHITATQEQKVKELASRKVPRVNMSSKKYAYVILGHGGDNPLEKIKVPDGCIVVVKAHSGDSTRDEEFTANLIRLTHVYNRDIILNPNAKQSDLYDLLNDRGNHSVAIYNQREEVNNLSFQLVLFFDESSSIEDSGILKIDSKTPSFVPVKRIIKGQAFSKSNDTWVLNKIEDKNIWDIFVDSSMYEYYYTKIHIKDICDAYTYLANVRQDSPESFTKIKEEFNTKFSNIIRKPKDDDRTILQRIIHLINYTESESGLQFNDIAYALQNYTQNQLLLSITRLSRISLSSIFEDINSGLIKAGIIYNLSCRDTQNTNNGMLAVDLDEKGVEQFPKVHSMLEESKNRVGEAEAHRKAQILQVSRRLQINNSNEYKQYKKNKNKANSYTYKKGSNGKWQRYKTGVLYNTKKVPKAVSPNKGVIHTSQNKQNYVMVNGKWKTRKWNTARQEYVNETNNSTRKNTKVSEVPT